MGVKSVGYLNSSINLASQAEFTFLESTLPFVDRYTDMAVANPYRKQQQTNGPTSCQEHHKPPTKAGGNFSVMKGVTTIFFLNKASDNTL